VQDYRILVGKPEGKIPLLKRRRKWDDSISIGLKEIRCEGVDCIHMVQDRTKQQFLMNKVMGLLNYLLFLGNLRFSIFFICSERMGSLDQF
jgi:hypothetical protein